MEKLGIFLRKTLENILVREYNLHSLGSILALIAKTVIILVHTIWTKEFSRRYDASFRAAFHVL
jgi:hypothetical protein